ncbi:MAG: DUF4870 domain-containing protein [Verrucomicrobium sp.]
MDPLPPSQPPYGDKPDPAPVPGSGDAPSVPSIESNVPSDQRNMALFCHLGGIVGLVLPSAGNILLPLILWLVNKDKMPFVDQEGKEATNFQISISIYLLAATILMFVTCGIGFILPIGVLVFDIVVVVMASIDSSKGIPYRYPVCIRLIK